MGKNPELDNQYIGRSEMGDQDYIISVAKGSFLFNVYAVGERADIMSHIYKRPTRQWINLRTLDDLLLNIETDEFGMRRGRCILYLSLSYLGTP